MDCDFCGEDIEDKGLLITRGALLKEWACPGCFVTELIKGRADIVHHWGFDIGETVDEPEPKEK